MKGPCQECACWVRFPTLHPKGDKFGQCQLQPSVVGLLMQDSVTKKVGPVYFTTWAETGEQDGCHNYRNKEIEASMVGLRDTMYGRTAGEKN